MKKNLNIVKNCLTTDPFSYYNNVDFSFGGVK